MNRSLLKKYIRESNKIEGIHSETEVIQSLIAWDYLQALTTINQTDICAIQKIITANQTNLLGNQRGFYRNVSMINVRVGSYVAPDYSEVAQLMADWFNDWLKMTPLIAHIRFETIHPFVDGNGRVGRMLYWWQCVKAGRVPTLYTNQKKLFYYNLFDSKRISKLKETNWGIDYKPKFVVTVKLKDRSIVRGEFYDDPTEEDIRKSIPEGKELDKVISIKKL